MKKFGVTSLALFLVSTANATDACDDYEFAKKALANNQAYEIWFNQSDHIPNAEAGVKYWEPKCKKLRLPGARIGMNEKQVLNNTNWGTPKSVNRTTTRYGVREQWVYGNGNYLYFENGKLITIQN